MSVRVLLADDHPLFRDGIASLLSARDYVVVGQAGNGAEAVQLVEELDPDLVLMDIRMPGVNGLAATRLIQASHPDTKIVILTVSEEDADLFEAIKSGAAGYIQKSLDSDPFFELLDGVLRGEAGLTPVLAGKILREYAHDQRPSTQPRQEDLTPRERQVLELVTQGATNAEIARQLAVTENTVKFHMKNILGKLHASNRAEVVAYALKSGLIPMPPEEPSSLRL
jgi:DNA-binding NarL/FixJ family response regulator